MTEWAPGGLGETRATTIEKEGRKGGRGRKNKGEEGREEGRKKKGWVVYLTLIPHVGIADSEKNNPTA